MSEERLRKSDSGKSAPDRAAQIDRIFAILPSEEITKVDADQANEIFANVRAIVDEVVSDAKRYQGEALDTFINDQVEPLLNALSINSEKVHIFSPEDVTDQKQKLRQRLISQRRRLNILLNKKRKEEVAPPVAPEKVEVVTPPNLEIGRTEGETLLALAQTLQARLEATVSTLDFNPLTEMDDTAGGNVLSVLETRIAEFNDTFVQPLARSSQPSDVIRSQELNRLYLVQARQTEANLQQRIEAIKQKPFNEARAAIPAWGMLEADLLSPEETSSVNLRYHILYLNGRIAEAQAAIASQPEDIQNFFERQVLGPAQEKFNRLLQEYFDYLRGEVLKPDFEDLTHPTDPSITAEVNLLRQALVLSKTVTSGDVNPYLERLNRTWEAAINMSIPTGWEILDGTGENIFPSATLNAEALRKAVREKYQKIIESEKKRLEEIKRQQEEQRAADETTRAQEEAVRVKEESLRPITDVVRQILEINVATRNGLNTKQLEEIRDNLATLVNRARVDGAFNETDNPAVNTMLRRVQGEISSATTAIERYIAASKERKPFAEWTVEELSELILRPEENTGVGKINPFDWAYWDTAMPSPNKALRDAYISKIAFSENADPEENLRRLVYKVLVQLGTMDNKLIHETGTASGDRTKLYSEVENRQIARHEILKAATYHPVWGREVREMIRFVIEHAALRRKDPGYIPGLSYETLSSEDGRPSLGRELQKRFPDYHPMAHRFASLLFTSFDMLTIALRERQKQTMTRGHNGSLDDKDRILLQDPLAAAIHRAQRYGGNEKDWTLWWLLYLKPVPTGHKYGAQGREVAGRDADDGALALNHIREMLILHQEVFYDTSSFVGQIEYRGFCESFFPDTWNLVTLYPGTAADPERGRAYQPEETVRVMNRLYGHNPENGDDYLLEFTGNEVHDYEGRLVARINGDRVDILIGPKAGRSQYLDEAQVTLPDGRVIGIKDSVSDRRISLYTVAENGWEEVLKLAFEKMNPNLTYKQILEEAKEGGKGGLLAQWLQKAGEAKMFPGNHLRDALTPMLTHFIFRLFSNYAATTKKDRLILFKGVVKALKKTKDSGGLAGTEELRGAMDQVLRNLGVPDEKLNTANEDDLTEHDMARSLYYYRDQQVRQNALQHYAQEWYEEEFHEEPPSRKGEFLPDITDTREERVKEYYSILQGRVAVPQPINRTGSMLQEKEAKK